MCFVNGLKLAADLKIVPHFLLYTLIKLYNAISNISKHLIWRKYYAIIKQKLYAIVVCDVHDHAYAQPSKILILIV